jgi:hypothetical protein
LAALGELDCECAFAANGDKAAANARAGISLMNFDMVEFFP